MTRTPPLSRRRTRGLAALVVAGAAMSALGGQALATTAPVELQPRPYEPAKLHVEKTAQTYHAAYWKWHLDKTPSTKVGYNHENHHVKVGYKVTATPKVIKTGSYKVYGQIRLHNPAKYRGMLIHGIYDSIGDTKCTISQMHGGGGGGVATEEGVDTAPAGYLGAGQRAYVNYECYFGTEPGARSGKNRATVKWSYAPRPQPWVAGSPLMSSEDDASLRRRVHMSKAYAGYDFDKGEVDNRGYTTATVWDRMQGKKPELLGKDISALDGAKTWSYYKYLRAPRKVNECVIIKNRAILKAEKADAQQNAIVVEPGWGKAHADAYVKICTKERNPSSEDPRPPVVDVTPGSSEDPAQNTPAPTPKPADVKPSDFDPKDPPSSEDPKPNGKGNIEVSKRANKKKAYVGSRVVWKIRVSNTGGKTVKNVLVRDRLPKYFRATKVLGRKKGVTLRPRNVRVKIAQLRPGQSKTIRIVSRVVGRPQMNKPVKLAASKKRGKARKVYVQRMKRGIACNVVLARGKRGGSDRGEACLRVLAPKKSAGPSKTEVAPPSNGSGQGQEIV